MTIPDTTRLQIWNPLLFKCLHRCRYCPEWGKQTERVPVLSDDWNQVPGGGFRHPIGVWVGDNTDIFHDAVSSDMISKILEKASTVNQGYVFCTKNPKRYKEFLGEYPFWSYLCTTIESDIDHRLSYAEPPVKRFEHLMELKNLLRTRLFPDIELLLCLQPLAKYSPRFIELLTILEPDQVSIGPEKRGKDGPWASYEEALQLAVQLKQRLPDARINVHGRSVHRQHHQDTPLYESVITREEWKAVREEYL